VSCCYDNYEPPRVKWRRLGWRMFWAAMLTIVLCAIWPPHGDAATVSGLVKRAHGNPFRCNTGSQAYSAAENKCVVRVVFKREPSIARRAARIIRCESNWNEREVNGSSGASGLAQFLRGTWRALPRRLSRHSVLHPVWNVRGMRYLRMHDGDFHQWVCQ